MGLKKPKLWFAALIAFLLGMPLAEPAQAGRATGIVESSLGLAFAIIRAAEGS